MLINIIQYIIISIILISLIHYFFTFFKKNLTVPKVKVMINIPSKRYKDIIESIDNKNKIDNASNKMKDELKQYMASLINTNKVNKEKNIEFENINSNKSFDNSYSSY